jgi:hypothetical protein
LSTERAVEVNEALHPTPWRNHGNRGAGLP